MSFERSFSVLQQGLLSTTTKNFLGGAKRPADWIRVVVALILGSTND